MRLLVGYGRQPIIFGDGILVVEQSVTQQLKLSHDLQHFTWFLTKLDHIYQPLRSGRIWHKVNF